MSLPRELPSKKEVALMLLESSDVFIHLDPRKEQVVVPPHLRRQPHLILQVGLNMPVPIPDLDVDDLGISCTLSFNRSPFWCKLPWNSVYALVSKDARGMVWPDDVPPEVAVKFVRQPGQEEVASKPQPVPQEAPPASAKPKKAARKRKRSPLTEAAESQPAAPSPAVAEDTSAPAPEPPAKRKRELPPYLRVVK